MPLLGADALFRATWRLTISGEKCTNVAWYYRLGTDTGDANLLAASLDTAALANYRAWAHTATSFDEIEVINETLLTDFHTRSLGGVAGLAAGDPQPSFLAARVKYLRTSRETRNGWKRFGGLVEGDTSGNTLAAAAETRLAPIADNFVGLMASVFRPCIVRFTYDPVTNERLQPSQWIYNLITGRSIEGITTQNSRKPGVGD